MVGWQVTGSRHRAGWQVTDSRHFAGWQDTGKTQISVRQVGSAKSRYIRNRAVGRRVVRFRLELATVKQTNKRVNQRHSQRASQGSGRAQALSDRSGQQQKIKHRNR